MTKEYVYKKQGDGRDSWTCIEREGDVIVASYMVYENPFETPKVDLIAILSKATPEEIAFLKEALK